MCTAVSIETPAGDPPMDAEPVVVVPVQDASSGDDYDLPCTD